MVRPDEIKLSALPRVGGAISGCVVPAGASPVRVSAEAPGSRPQAGGEILPAQAGCREPLRREQERGRQHEVNPGASKDKQWEGRAAHVTAKATSGPKFHDAIARIPFIHQAFSWISEFRY